MEKHDMIEIAIKIRTLFPQFGRKIIRPFELKVPRHVPMQALALNMLRNSTMPLTMTELATEMKNTKQYTTLIVDKLINEGLAARIDDENDRRVIRLVITEHGINFLKQQEALILDDLIEKMESFDIGDMEGIKDALDKVIRLMELFP